MEEGMQSLVQFCDDCWVVQREFPADTEMINTKYVYNYQAPTKNYQPNITQNSEYTLYKQKIPSTDRGYLYNSSSNGSQHQGCPAVSGGTPKPVKQDCFFYMETTKLWWYIIDGNTYRVGESMNLS